MSQAPAHAAERILGLLFDAMALSSVITGIGLVRSRRHMMWKTPGRNMLTGKWSNELNSDDEDARWRRGHMPLSGRHADGQTAEPFDL